MWEEKPAPPIPQQVPRINFSCRDGKKLLSTVWNQDVLVDKKRRWLLGLSIVSMPDGSQKRSKRPKFMTDKSLTEACVRSDEVSYETVRTNVEKSFGAFSNCQSMHHVVDDFLQLFETSNFKTYSTNPSYFLKKFYSMMNVLNNRALFLVANLVTDNKVIYEKTCLRMKKIIRHHLPKFLEKSSNKDCVTPMNQLTHIFRDPSNFQKYQLTFRTPISPSLSSSIHKALAELVEMPTEDLNAMNRKLRDVSIIPQFPTAKFTGKRDVLFERVKKKCQKYLLALKDGADLPKPFAKALSVVNLSLKHKTRCIDIINSEFFPFSPEIVGIQNDIISALWSLLRVRMHELKKLQPVVDPKAKITILSFRNAIKRYLMECLFECDEVNIPDEGLSIIAFLNRRSRRRAQLFTREMIDEDVEATLIISSRLRRTVSNLLAEDRCDDELEDFESDGESASNDFDLAESSYYSNQGSCLSDVEEEGIGETGVASCSPWTADVNDNFAEKKPRLNPEDTTQVDIDQSCMVDEFVRKIPKLEQSTLDSGGKILIQEICDETSLAAYRLVGHILDKFMQIQGGDTNEMMRDYLTGGSSLEPIGLNGSLKGSKESTAANVLIQSVQELLPNFPKSCIDMVKKLMG